jgi:hypothetical protein
MGLNYDDGFLRISAGGGTNVSSKSFIDLSGYSNIPDMNKNIVFGTKGIERMRLDQDGNFSVGVEIDTVPFVNDYAKFLLMGSNSVTYSLNGAYGSSTNTNDGLVSMIYNLSQATGSYAGIKLITRSSSAKKWGMYNVSKGIVSGDLVFGHGQGDGTGTEVMRLTDDNNMGIGTTGPNSKLHVYGTDTVFKVDGTNGELINIEDSSNGSLFTVNDASGLPIIDIKDDSSVIMGNYQAPSLYTTKKVIVSTTGNNIIHTIPIGEYNSFFFDYSIQSGNNLRAGTNIVITNGTTTNSTDLSTLDIGNTNSLEFDATVSGTNLQLRVINTTPNWTIKLIIRTI